MTSDEKKTIDRLLGAIQEIRDQNQKFREQISEHVGQLEARVEKKYMPIKFEQDILSAAQAAIGDVIVKSMVEFGSPVKKLVDSVITEHSTELRQIISDSFSQVIRTDEFKQSIVSAFSHKVARTIISNNDGLFDNVANDLKKDAIFKAKMSLAVSNVVEECLRERKVAE
jgi:hypothetical protein